MLFRRVTNLINLLFPVCCCLELHWTQHATKINTGTCGAQWSLRKDYCSPCSSRLAVTLEFTRVNQSASLCCVRHKSNVGGRICECPLSTDVTSAKHVAVFTSLTVVADYIAARSLQTSPVEGPIHLEKYFSNIAAVNLVYGITASAVDGRCHYGCSLLAPP